MLRKINKLTARKIFNEGHKVFLIPCKCRTNSVWQTGCWIDNTTFDRSFDSIVDEFEYYNCNKELGTYSAYYIKE